MANSNSDESSFGDIIEQLRHDRDQDFKVHDAINLHLGFDDQSDLST